MIRMKHIVCDMYMMNDMYDTDLMRIYMMHDIIVCDIYVMHDTYDTYLT